MTFSQCVHGVYDEKMEAVYQKYSQNDSFRKTPRVHIIRRRYFVMVDAGFLSIIPPIVAIVLALVTKEVIFSLLLGVFSGTSIYSALAGLGPFGVLSTTVDINAVKE